MAGLQPPALESADEKRNSIVFLERQPTNADLEMAKPVPAATKTDYSGAHEKTNPKEIALVKKLDRWIMPMLWSMYWLNYLDRNAIALARLNDLEEDLNLSSTRKYLAICGNVIKEGACTDRDGVLQSTRLASVFCSWDTCSGRSRATCS